MFIKLTRPARRVTHSKADSFSRQISSVDPGAKGLALSRKVAEMAQAGKLECAMIVEQDLPASVCQKLPLWIQQFKMRYPQMDFHILNRRHS